MLKTTILNTLLVCYRNDRMLPKDLLKIECERRMGGKLGDGEFDAAMGELADGKFIDSVENKLTHDSKYFITDLGRTQL